MPTPLVGRYYFRNYDIICNHLAESIFLHNEPQLFELNCHFLNRTYLNIHFKNIHLMRLSVWLPSCNFQNYSKPSNLGVRESRGWIQTSLKSFPPCYSQSFTSTALPWNLYFFKLTQPPTVSTVQLLYTVKDKGGKPGRKPYPLPYGLRNPYLQKETSSLRTQDYAQTLKEIVCAWMNSASVQLCLQKELTTQEYFPQLPPQAEWIYFWTTKCIYFYCKNKFVKLF